MDNHDRWTVDSAVEAAKENRLREWLIEYLRNEGKNEKLADAIEENTETMTILPPQMMTLEPLQYIVGPEDAGRMWTDNNWEENIQKFVELIEKGWESPPLIITDYWGTPLSITDGNHRAEALKRLGYTEYWVIELRNKVKVKLS